MLTKVFLIFQCKVLLHFTIPSG